MHPRVQQGTSPPVAPHLAAATPHQLTMPDFILWDHHCRFWGAPVDEIGSTPPGEHRAAWAPMSMASHTTCWR